MPRRTFKLTVRLSVPEQAGNLPLSPEAREFIRDALEDEALVLLRADNLLRLHERYLSHERKKAAAARRDVQAAIVKKPAKNSVDAEKTSAAASEKNIPAEESPKAAGQNATGDTAPTGTEHSEPGEKAASIDLPPGNLPGEVLKTGADTPSKQP